MTDCILRIQQSRLQKFSHPSSWRSDWALQLCVHPHCWFQYFEDWVYELHWWSWQHVPCWPR